MADIRIMEKCSSDFVVVQRLRNSELIVRHTQNIILQITNIVVGVSDESSRK